SLPASPYARGGVKRVSPNHLKSVFLYRRRQRKGEDSSSMSCDMDTKERSPFLWASLGREKLKTNVLRGSAFEIVLH
ncbi:MAG: hypothetical protein AAB972_03785, partial [Patescibacteria group bacterium]